ncbi:MAG: ABC-F family ATP-binding cassette domain-containing protein, partial [Polyangiaceae bacterium]
PRPVISISNLAKGFGPRTLFAGVSLQLDAGNCYGLVGANGAGKTTLLKILMGDEPASDGSITFARNARVGVLRQDRFEDDSQRILDCAMKGDLEVFEALREQETWDEDSHVDPERIAHITEVISAGDGYTLESRASQVLVGLGIPDEALTRPLSTLSGGFKLRVLLAQTLVARPDILLLDEPTNHLDILSIRWLEGFLKAYKGCAVVISHDIRFLDAVSTHILDVDYGTVTAYKGNYAAFCHQKEETRIRKEAEIAKNERIIAEKKAFVERFSAKATKARQAQSRVKQIEKIQVEELPKSSRRYPKFAFKQKRPSGKDVLEVEGLSKAYGKKQVLGDVELRIRRGEHVAVIGANGLGKSTLLKILVDRLEADAGKVNWGHEVQIGYFAQDHKDLLSEPKQTTLNFLWDTCPQEGTSYVRGMLGRVLFSGEEVEKPLEALSGGEAARLVFSRIMVQQPNVLVLDEPTNHLDLESIEALVKALKEYDGTLLFVSHDRWFVDQLATRVVEIKADGIVDFPGTYAEYLEREGDDHLDADQVVLRAKSEKEPKNAEKVPSIAPSPPPDPDAGLSHEERRRRANKRKALPKKRDELMSQIESTEARKSEIEAKYCEPGFFEQTPEKEVNQLRREEAEIESRLDRLMSEWEEVEAELIELGMA